MSKRIWERRPTETHQAFAAFSIYRDLGPARAVDCAYHISMGNLEDGQLWEQKRGSLGGASGRWNKWTQDHDWTERARAFDEYLEEEKLKAEVAVKRRHGITAANARAEVTQRTIDTYVLVAAQMDALAAKLIDVPVKTMDEAKTLVGIIKELRDLVGPFVFPPTPTGTGAGTALSQVNVHLHSQGMGQDTVNPELMGREELLAELIDREAYEVVQRVKAKTVVLEEEKAQPALPEGNGNGSGKE